MELEINPLIVRPDGKGAVAADAVLQLQGEAPSLSPEGAPA